MCHEFEIMRVLYSSTLNVFANSREAYAAAIVDATPIEKYRQRRVLELQDFIKYPCGNSGAVSDRVQLLFDSEAV